MDTGSLLCINWKPLAAATLPHEKLNCSFWLKKNSKFVFLGRGGYQAMLGSRTAALPSVFLSEILESNSQLSTDHHGRNKRGRTIFRQCVRDTSPPDRGKGEGTLFSPWQRLFRWVISSCRPVSMARCWCFRKAIPLSTLATCCSSLPASMAAVTHCQCYVSLCFNLFTFISRFFPAALGKISDRPNLAGDEKNKSCKRFDFCADGRWCSAVVLAYLDAEATRSS